MCSVFSLSDGTDFTQPVKCLCVWLQMSPSYAWMQLFTCLNISKMFILSKKNVNLEQMHECILEKIAHDCRPVIAPLAGPVSFAHVVTTCSPW